MMKKIWDLAWLTSLVFAIALVVFILVASCNQQGTNFGQRVHLGGTPSWVYALVGQVANQPILAALVTNRYGLALAYLSDGEHLSEWFSGPIDGTTMDLTNSDGTRLQATLTSQGAQGMLTLHDSAPLSLVMHLAPQPAGLYRAKEEVNGEVYLAGWILLPDGRQAGLIENQTQQLLPAPRLDPAHPAIILPDGGMLTPQLVTPDSDL